MSFAPSAFKNRQTYGGKPSLQSDVLLARVHQVIMLDTFAFRTLKSEP